MPIPEIVALIAALCPVGRGHCPNLQERKALGAILATEARGLPLPIVVAVIHAESGWDPTALGARGEMGLAQIMPGGMALYLCRRFKNLWDARQNIACGARILRWARKLCGVDDPLVWLSIYAGHRLCGPSNYSRKVTAYLIDSTQAH